MDLTDNVPPCDFMMNGRVSHMVTIGDYDILIFTLPQNCSHTQLLEAQFSAVRLGHTCQSAKELCFGKQQKFLVLSEYISYFLKLCY